MGHIQRYVVAEVLKVFFVTLSLSVVLLALGGGAKEGLRNGLPPALILQLFPFLVLEMLRYTIPGCLLFAVCSVFGRMSASHEITALKSLGISPLRLIWPVLVATYVLSIGTFLLYDVCAAWARPNLKRIVVQSVADVAYGVLKADGSFSAHGVSIIVKDVKQERLIQPVITLLPEAGKTEMALSAREAELQFDSETGSLQLICYDAHVDIGDKVSMDFPDRFVHEIVIPGASGQAEHELSPAALARQAIPRQIVWEQNQLDMLRDRLAKTQTAPQREADLQGFDYHQQRLYRLQAESQRRLSNGFACFCFGLVGIPVSVWWRSADNISAFFVCFLPILVVFYPLLVVGETLARQGIVPMVSVWLANAVLMVAGLWLMRRVLRR